MIAADADERAIAPRDTTRRAVGGPQARAARRNTAISLSLLAPLFALLFFCFAFPVGGMFWRAIYDSDVRDALPLTTSALERWDGAALPDDRAFEALITDLRQADPTLVASAARRLNYDVAGFRSLLLKTARRLQQTEGLPAKGGLLQIDRTWGDKGHWEAIWRASGSFTSFYLLSALDMRKGIDGAINRRPADESIYVSVLLRTLQLSATITLFCVLLGFPVAYALVTLPRRLASIALVLVLLPFWTSILARTTAWVVLLQNNGVLNSILMNVGLTSEPVQLIYNRFGVLVTMTHILLPFMILPLYSVMRGINPSYMRAANSLGAGPVRAFVRVYLPLCLPGVGSGATLVFTLALGYYITPALVGGAGDQMISYFIAFYTNTTTNWGLAAALGLMLLLTTLSLFALYAGVSGLRGGARGYPNLEARERKAR